MKNPYHDTIPSDTISVSRKIALSGVVVFLLFLVLPPSLGLRGFLSVESPDDGTLREALRSFEKRFSEIIPFSEWREVDQSLLVRLFREGNNRILIGNNGWLFYRSDVDTVVGKGPEYEEPPSVARDPGLEPWQSPLPVIYDFAEQLEEKGIRLVLVPVPTKAMMHPEKLGAKVAKANPFRYRETLGEIRSKGVVVVDLTLRKHSWMRQDTHWNSVTASRAAKAAAKAVESSEPAEVFQWKPFVYTVEDYGDLVGMVGGKVGGAFPKERTLLERIQSADSGKAVPFDEAAPVVVLGDSFVNIFEDPSLGFSIPDVERIGAGFSSHLSSILKQKVAVIANNGGGATTVRKRFAELLSRRKTKPQAVVWVLSARDLFLAEIPGRRARVDWEFVKLPELTNKPEIKQEPGEVILTATLLEKSRIGDESERNSAAYDSAIYSGIFGDLSVESGTYEEMEVWAFLWAAKNRKLLETAHLKVGSRYRLKLVPFPDEGAVSTATQLDDFFRADLMRYYAVEAAEAE